jgi:CBS domain-containing protein
MPTAQDILSNKGAHLQTISPGASVLEATHKMNQNKIGALVVLEGKQMVGIFTERDVLRRIVGEQRMPGQVLVGEVMTTDVICCRPNTDVDEISALMKERRIRHVPVCDDSGDVTGLVSMGDLNALHATNQEAHIHFLNDYVFGRA